MFRFSIRELVLLTLVVAMGVGWWSDHRSQDTQMNELVQLAWDLLGDEPVDAHALSFVLDSKKY